MLGRAATAVVHAQRERHTHVRTYTRARARAGFAAADTRARAQQQELGKAEKNTRPQEELTLSEPLKSSWMCTDAIGLALGGSYARAAATLSPPWRRAS